MYYVSSEDDLKYAENWKDSFVTDVYRRLWRWLYSMRLRPRCSPYKCSLQLIQRHTETPPKSRLHHLGWSKCCRLFSKVCHLWTTKHWRHFLLQSTATTATTTWSARESSDSKQQAISWSVVLMSMSGYASPRCHCCALQTTEHDGPTSPQKRLSWYSNDARAPRGFRTNVAVAPMMETNGTNRQRPKRVAG